MNVVVTGHARMRMEERAGIYRNTEQEERALAALWYGTRTSDCKGYLRNCMEHYDRFCYKELGRELYYYKGMIHVFQENFLITVFPIEEAVRRAAIRKQKKKKIAKENRRRRDIEKIA